MIDAGMGVARLNLTKGNAKYQIPLVKVLREALKKRPKSHIALMMTTRGPEIKIGELKDEKISLSKNQILEISNDPLKIGDDDGIISCDYEELWKNLTKGEKIYLQEGEIEAEVVEILNNSFKIRILISGTLHQYSHMYPKSSAIKLPTISEQDEEDIIKFAMREGVDLIAMSYVRSAEDINYMRDLLGPRGEHIKIIAKIECREALDKYDEILEAADGILVARGRLGLELPLEKIFAVQKYIIDKANIVGIFLLKIRKASNNCNTNA
jgi:pyruvate kinase